jgi:hypothetical protein
MALRRKTADLINSLGSLQEEITLCHYLQQQAKRLNNQQTKRT